MRHVEIILDLDTQLRHGQVLTMELAKAMARETMGLAQKRAWLYYGRLDMRQREKWRYEPLDEKERSQVTVGGSEDDRSHAVLNSVVGPLHVSWPLHNANAMNLHAMSNGTPVPAQWLISGWFDI